MCSGEDLASSASLYPLYLPQDLPVFFITSHMVSSVMFARSCSREMAFFQMGWPGALARIPFVTPSPGADPCREGMWLLAITNVTNLQSTSHACPTQYGPCSKWTLKWDGEGGLTLGQHWQRGTLNVRQDRSHVVPYFTRRACREGHT